VKAVAPGEAPGLSAPDPESIFAKMKGVAMRPETEPELSDLIRGAMSPIVVRGGGTRGVVQGAGDVLDTNGLRGVTLYEPGALTLVVRAGTGLAEVQALLAGERQRLSFEVPDLRAVLGREGGSTIGGVVAANASGPRRVQSGACRDSLLGVRFVDGAGTVVKNGGRVMKNVTGYDLVKLMAGSHGRLGVLTEVSLRVQAVPEAETTLVGSCSAEAGLAALRGALGSPFDISGAAYAQGQALIRVEGMAGSVAYRVGELRARLGGDWGVVTGAESAALWAGVRDVAPLQARVGSIWRLVVKQTAAMGLVQRLGGEAVYDWGGGLVWLALPGGQAESVRAAVAGFGHATLMRPSPGDEGVSALPPEPPAVAALSAALRQRFDPRQIFSA
jgi:glycolate oxidase FAD binding subunit